MVDLGETEALGWAQHLAGGDLVQVAVLLVVYQNRVIYRGAVVVVEVDILMLHGVVVLVQQVALLHRSLVVLLKLADQALLLGALRGGFRPQAGTKRGMDVEAVLTDALRLPLVAVELVFVHIRVVLGVFFVQIVVLAMVGGSEARLLGPVLSLLAIVALVQILPLVEAVKHLDCLLGLDHRFGVNGAGMTAVALVGKRVDGVERPGIPWAARGHVLRRVEGLRVTRPDVLALDIGCSVITRRSALLILIVRVTDSQKVGPIRQLGIEGGTVPFRALRVRPLAFAILPALSPRLRLL